MKIEFLQDYRGVLTGELFFKAGVVVDTDDKGNEAINGKQLVEDGRAKSTMKKAEKKK